MGVRNFGRGRFTTRRLFPDYEPMNTIRFPLAVLALGLATTGLAPNANAQTWPTKPVKVIAVFPAGGSVVKPHVDSGRVRAIAVTSLKPDPALPGAEPIASQGVPDFAAYTWWGVYAPANMPPALAKRIYDELAKAINAPAVKEKLQGQGIDVSGAPGSELDAFVRI